MTDERQRLPAHPPTPQGVSSHEPERHLLMSPALVAIGGLLAFFTVVAMVVVLPIATYQPPPSSNWLPLSDAAARGRATYLANGCVYCHSGFTRPQDVAVGQYYLYPRVAEPGDYTGVDQAPNILGSERTGPDLSQEGGMHPDDWHVAHYANPRNVQPLSIMPQFSFLQEAALDDMIAFNQSSGGKDALLRYATIGVGDRLMTLNGGKLSPEEAFPDLVARTRADGTFKADGSPMDASPWGLPWQLVWHINSFERSYWLTRDPLPLTEASLVRGKQIYLERCSACHGATGDGKGPGAAFLVPGPFDFSAGNTSMNDIDGPGASDGMLYHRILTGGPGTAMENFGTRLSVEDIWRVVLFLRTIQNGSLATQDTVPTPDMYTEWEAPDPLLRYIAAHPIEDGPGVIGAGEDPFQAAAHWLAPGLSPQDDAILVGGKLPMTAQGLADEIRATYLGMVERAYDDAVARREPLPPRDQVMSTDGLEFHAPS